MNVEAKGGVVVNQCGGLNAKRKVFHHGISLLGADTDPDQYLQIPRQCAVDRQRQDSVGVYR